MKMFKELGIISIILTSLLLSFSSQAKIFKLENNSTIQKNIDDALKIFLDLENYCNKSCKYKLTDVEEVKIVEWIDKDHFYTWMHVNGLRTFKYFSYYTIESDRNVTKVTTSYPSKSEVDRLSKNYKLPHKTPFKSSYTVWKFIPQSENLTDINYVGKFSISSILANTFGGLIKESLNRTFEELLLAMLEDKSLSTFPYLKY